VENAQRFPSDGGEVVNRARDDVRSLGGRCQRGCPLLHRRGSVHSALGLDVVVGHQASDVLTLWRILRGATRYAVAGTVSTGQRRG